MPFGRSPVLHGLVPHGPGLRAAAVRGLAIGAALLTLGAPAGLIWAALAPHPDYAQAANGAFEAFEPTVGADASYGLICLLAGLLAGALARWLAARRCQPRPVEGLLAAGVLAGGLGAGLVASRVGALARRGPLEHLLGSLLSQGAQASAVHQFADTVAFVVHARELLAAFPLGAALGWALVLAVTTGPDSRAATIGSSESSAGAG